MKGVDLTLAIRGRNGEIFLKLSDVRVTSSFRGGEVQMGPFFRKILRRDPNQSNLLEIFKVGGGGGFKIVKPFPPEAFQSGHI